MSQQATRKKTVSSDAPLDLREAAARFGLSERELRQFVNLERIPYERAVRKGRVEIVVRPRDVELFLADRTQGTAAPQAAPAPRSEPELEAPFEPVPEPRREPTPEPPLQAGSNLPAHRLEDLLAERERRHQTEVALARSQAQCEALELRLDDLRIELKATRGERLTLLSRTQHLLESPDGSAPVTAPWIRSPWTVAGGAVALLALGTALALALVEGVRSERRAGDLKRQSDTLTQRAEDLETRADGLGLRMESLRDDLRGSEMAALGVRRELVQANGQAELERRSRERATAERERALVDLASAHGENANLLGAQAAAIAERDSLAEERDAIQTENTDLLRDREATASERDAALRALATSRLLMSDVRRVQEWMASERDEALRDLHAAETRIEDLTVEGATAAAELDRLGEALREQRAAALREQQADELREHQASELRARQATDALRDAWPPVANGLLRVALLLGR
ncbi:MAG TPA: hypothetical protein QF764_14065 [Planctomycetota bacterium]|nr:hypothetical protein [Planctomycetota bacterium]